MALAGIKSEACLPSTVSAFPPLAGRLVGRPSKSEYFPVKATVFKSASHRAIFPKATDSFSPVERFTRVPAIVKDTVWFEASVPVGPLMLIPWSFTVREYSPLGEVRVIPLRRLNPSSLEKYRYCRGDQKENSPSVPMRVEGVLAW